MTLQNLTWEELDRHLRQAQLAQETALEHGNQEVYQHAEELEEEIIEERMRRQQERQEPDTQVITL